MKCECGCGQETPLAPRTDTAKGWTRGEPLRFVRFHHTRRPGEPEYVVDDRGYKTPCWIWQRTRNPQGYGQQNKAGAHRVYFERANGPLPPGMEPDHLCRVRCCVNPAHMEAVTRGENARRGAKAKLTWAGVRLIRRSSASALELAIIFGVDRSTIYSVRGRRSWWPEPDPGVWAVMLPKEPDAAAA
jgi:hypothetical protein